MCIRDRFSVFKENEFVFLRKKKYFRLASPAAVWTTVSWRSGPWCSTAPGTLPTQTCLSRIPTQNWPSSRKHMRTKRKCKEKMTTTRQTRTQTHADKTELEDKLRAWLERKSVPCWPISLSFTRLWQWKIVLKTSWRSGQNESPTLEDQAEWEQQRKRGTWKKTNSKRKI